MPLYCFDCTVYLAVYGYRACAYTIQASSSGVIQLQAGQATGETASATLISICSHICYYLSFNVPNLSLLSGGHVSNEKFSYYSIHNRNQFGLMKFTLTMVRPLAHLLMLVCLFFYLTFLPYCLSVLVQWSLHCFLADLGRRGPVHRAPPARSPVRAAVPHALHLAQPVRGQRRARHRLPGPALLLRLRLHCRYVAWHPLGPMLLFGTYLLTNLY